jgi:hypothetical protein
MRDAGEVRGNASRGKLPPGLSRRVDEPIYSLVTRLYAVVSLQPGLRKSAERERGVVPTSLTYVPRDWKSPKQGAYSVAVASIMKVTYCMYT